jgi:hypothetical protein
MIPLPSFELSHPLHALLVAWPVGLLEGSGIPCRVEGIFGIRDFFGSLFFLGKCFIHVLNQNTIVAFTCLRTKLGRL